MTTASGRRLKRRTLDKQERTSSRSKRYRKSKTGQRTSQKKSTKLNSSRPQRIAARDAMDNFQIPETSTDEDEYASAGETSESESSLEGSSIQRKELNEPVQYLVSSDRSDELGKPRLDHPDSRTNIGNKTNLVLRFSLNRKTPTLSENHVDRLESQTSIASSTLKASEENPVEERVNSGSGDLTSSSAIIVDEEHTESYRRQLKDVEKSTEAGNELNGVKRNRLKIKIGTSNGTRLRNLVPPNINAERTDGCLRSEGEDRSLSSVMPSFHGYQQLDNDSDVLNKNRFDGRETDLSTSDLRGSTSFNVDAKLLLEPLSISKKKHPILKIKPLKTPGASPGKLPGNTSLDASSGVAGESTSKTVQEKQILDVSMPENFMDEPNHFPDFHVSGDKADNDGPNVSFHNQAAEAPDLATDSARRARSLRLKNTFWEGGPANHNFEMGVDYLPPGTSRDAERSSKKATVKIQFEGSNHAGRSRSSRDKVEDYYRRDASSLGERSKNHMPKKMNWLLLTELELEEGYRYIPQLGDEVVYLRQVEH